MDVTTLTGLCVAAAVLAASTVFGLWYRRRSGQLRPVQVRPLAEAGRDASTAGAGPEPVPELLAGLGVQAGTPVTLLQFSSAFCAPCRATRRILADVANTVAGVRHVEVDAESHLDAVRALDVWRTPTVLVVDGTGRVVRRATGQPSKAQVVAAVAPLLHLDQPNCSTPGRLEAS